MSLPIIGSILEIGKELVSGWRERRRIQAEGSVRIEQARVDATVKQIESNDAMDGKLEEISLSTRTWKDEYLLLITTSPVVLVFFPAAVDDIQAGFAALASLPEWYMWIVLMIYVDTFGFRRVVRAWLEKKLR